MPDVEPNQPTGKPKPSAGISPAATAAPPLHRGRRWGWWVFLLLLVTAVATAPTGWLPWGANSLLREYLRVRDLSAIQVHVERLTPWNLRGSLALGTNGLVSHVGRIDVQYSPGGLRHRRLERVELCGGLLQFRIGTNGVSLCGLPPDLARLRAGASPVDDEESEPQPWQVGKALVDNVTLRLLPPEAKGRAEAGGASSASPASLRRSSPASSSESPPPFDICVHASAVTDGDETRVAIADYGRAGMLVNGAIRQATGDGWLVAVLPESQAQEWLRVAQWFVSDPRFQGSDLCAGDGGATLLARMEQWRPVLVQGDVSLRAATLLQDVSFSYDVRLHGVAQWEMEDSPRPTLSANADLNVRMASCPAFAWSDDREVPATASVAVKLTPRKAEWECQVASRAVLSHEAAQACVPPGTVLLPEATRLRLDGVFTSPDLAQWDGHADVTVMAAQPRLAGNGMTLVCSDLVVHATAAITNSKPAGVHGWVDMSGIEFTGNGVRCEGEAGVAFASAPPFAGADVAVTARVLRATVPAGAVSFNNNDEPLQAMASATVGWSSGGPCDICYAKLLVPPWQATVGSTTVGLPQGLKIFPQGSREADHARWSLQFEPTPVMWRSGGGIEGTAVVAMAGDLTISSNTFRAEPFLHVTDVACHAGNLTGGVARVMVQVVADMARGKGTLSGLYINAETEGAWLRGPDGLSMDGLHVRLPLQGTNQEICVADAPVLTWSNLAYQGVHVVPEGFALTTTGQSAAVQMKVGIQDTGLHAALHAHADWSHAWRVAVTAEVPPTVLADTEALRGLTRRLAGKELCVTGQVVAAASVSLAADRQPSVSLCAAMGNLDVGCPAEKWQVTGLSAGMSADGPRGWRTPQGQVVTFQSAHAGDLVFDGGAVRWQYRRGALLVEQADINWCDGLLHAFGVSIDPNDRHLETVLYAERIELGRLIAQTKVLQGTGAGRLYGRIPAKLDHGKLHLTESFLYSTPGETGILKLSNLDLVDQALAQGRVGATERQQVHTALQNLRYSVFRMDLSGGGANAALGVQIEGRSADHPEDPPVQLNLNLNGSLDDFFNYGVDFSKKLR